MKAPLSCLIVDDEPLALALLEDYVEKTAGLTLRFSTTNPLLALEWARDEKVDLIFLDMQMPELSGLQLLTILGQRCLVIVTTAYSEYAVQGYEHHVVDYLLKPVTFERFFMAVEKARQRLGAQLALPAEATSAAPSFLFIKTENRLVRVNLADILFLEGARDYVSVHLPQKKILTLQSMRSLEEQLPAQLFVRVHKSFIVAIGHIAFIEKNQVYIHNRYLPVSETYKEKLLASIKK